MAQVADVRAPTPPGTALIGAVGTGEGVPMPQVVVTVTVASSVADTASTRLSIFEYVAPLFFPSEDDDRPYLDVSHSQHTGNDVYRVPAHRNVHAFNDSTHSVPPYMSLARTSANNSILAGANS